MTELEELHDLQAQKAELQTRINEVEVKIADKLRAADIELLTGIRAELSERQSFYQANLSTFREQEQDYSNARSHIIAAQDAVTESKRHMPAVAEFLPEDPQVLRWRKAHDVLEQRLAAVQTELQQLLNPEILRQALIQAEHHIAQLTHSESNITRKLSGEIRSSFLDGSVANVDGTPISAAKSWVR